MKHSQIRTLVAIILAVVLVIGSVSTASAAPKAKSSIFIDDIGTGKIDYHFSWDKLQACYYNISVLQISDWSRYLYRSPAIAVDGNTTSVSGEGSVYGVDGEGIVSGYYYQIELRVFDKNLREIKHSFSCDVAYLN
jgi:hypothetical protein